MNDPVALEAVQTLLSFSRAAVCQQLAVDSNMADTMHSSDSCDVWDEDVDTKIHLDAAKVPFLLEIFQN